MKIYQIELPDSYEYNSAGKTHTLNLENITRITNQDIYIEENKIDTKWHVENYGFTLSASEIEVIFMHKKAWQLFLASGEEYCIVIENSLILENRIDNSLTEKLRSENCDVFFPYEMTDVLNGYDPLREKQLVNPNIREYKDHDFYLLGKKWGSFIYYLSKRGAIKMDAVELFTQTIDDEILALSYENKLNVFCQNVEWIQFSKQPQIINRERESEIYRTMEKNTAWSFNDKISIRKLLSVLSTTAIKLEIDLILQGGTLLGHIRHGGLIPWDDDVDLGIAQDSLGKLLNELRRYPEIEYSELIEPRTNAKYYKIWFNNGYKVNERIYRFPFVDLWIFEVTGNDIVFLNGIRCPGSARKHFVEIFFEGSKFKIPYNSIECLDTRYKDWKETIRIYPWSHKTEAIGAFPLKARITVDSDGRIINFSSKL